MPFASTSAHGTLSATFIWSAVIFWTIALIALTRALYVRGIRKRGTLTRGRLALMAGLYLLSPAAVVLLTQQVLALLAPETYFGKRPCFILPALLVPVLAAGISWLVIAGRGHGSAESKGSG